MHSLSVKFEWRIWRAFSYAHKIEEGLTIVATYCSRVRREASALLERRCILSLAASLTITVSTPAPLCHAYLFRSIRESYCIIKIHHATRSNLVRMGPVAARMDLRYGLPRSAIQPHEPRAKRNRQMDSGRS